METDELRSSAVSLHHQLASLKHEMESSILDKQSAADKVATLALDKNKCQSMLEAAAARLQLNEHELEQVLTENKRQLEKMSTVEFSVAEAEDRHQGIFPQHTWD